MSFSYEQLVAMERVAQEVAQNSYSPYSRFAVGAAVLTDSGDIIAGCNVENSSYGLTICAERVAVFQAVARGHRSLLAVVVYTPTMQATTPCGACRQVLNEFAPAVPVVAICDSDHRIETTLDALLPLAFGPASLS